MKNEATALPCECGSDADALLRMGPVSKPCRGRFSALTNRLLKSGLVTIGWLSMKDYVLQRTAAGNSAAKALFRQRGEQVACPTCNR